MKVVDRLAEANGRGLRVVDDRRPSSAPRSDEVASLSQLLHQRIVAELDVARVGKLDRDELRDRIDDIVRRIAVREDIPLSEHERAALVESVIDELTGHGPLEGLFADPDVTDVMVNGPNAVFVERNGQVTLTKVRFRDDAHLIHTIQRMVAKVGRRIDESSPMVDARLPDGSRINAVIPPLSVDGPSLSIRRFGAVRFAGDDLVERGALSKPALDYLARAVKKRTSILVAGGTGAGKTTLLNVLSQYLGSRERIITVEDAAELRLGQFNVVRLEARPPNLEGKGEVVIRDLLKNALRMRPDRIIVGEVRGAEVLDMLQAMNTGHEGSMTTVHANSCEDAIGRLMTMLGMTNSPLSERTMATLVARAIRVVVHVSRMDDGKRRITEISEVSGSDGIDIQLRPIFRFEEAGRAADGAILGECIQVGESAFVGRYACAPGDARR